MSFTIGSLFDGSGGFPLAATMCGGVPKWASEVEPYPIAVTKSRFPNVKHLGSVTDIKGGEVEPVDVITFGSPCQDLSVAGKRAGLKHEANGDDETTRSGLFMEAVRIIKEMREATNGLYPRFALWENVPGAFSSNKGEDFRIVLQELIQVAEPTAVMPEVPKAGWPYADSYCGDGWSIAYRVLDAQFWGVPQRRRRIYLVADFRGECAGKVSFEREGLRGYFETGGTTWQTAAGDAEAGSRATDCERDCIIYTRGYGGNVTVDGVSPTLEARAGTGGNNQPIVAYSINHQGGNIEQIIEDKTGTLTAAMNTSGNNKLSVAYSFDALSSNSMKSSNPHSGCRQVEVAKCLDTTDPNPCKNQGGIAVVEQVPYTLKIRSGCEGGGKGALIQEDLSATLATNNDQYLFQPICFEPGAASRLGGYCYEDKCETLRATMGDNQFAVAYPEVVLDDQGGSQISVRDDGKCPTLRAEMHGNVPCVLKEQHLFENHSQDSRYKGPLAVCPMLPAQLGTGGNNQPFVVEGESVYCLQGAGATSQNSQGMGYKASTSYTLNTTDVHGIAYLASGKETVGTLMANAGTKLWLGNQEAFSGDYHVIEESPIQYIVRRLTPTECARLQGFPDTWGHPVEKTEFTDEEYRFWLNVRNTHAAINDKATKDYTEDQILKWYNGLHTDSSEYKMWGNGIALPNALYMMQGIADVMSEEKSARKKWLYDLLK